MTQDGEHMQSSMVISRAKDDMGIVIGVRNSNPVLDTCVYSVMFPDVSLQHYAANVIA